MARIERITKARASKRARRCERCGTEIVAGMPYKKLSVNRFSATRFRCVDEPDWRGSDMTTSKLATAYAGQENAHDALDAIEASSYVGDDGVFDADSFVDDVRSALESASEAATETATEYQDGIDALPYELQSNPVAEESQEKIDELESYADNLSSWSTSESFDADHDEDDDYADQVETFVEAVLDEASEAIDELAL